MIRQLDPAHRCIGGEAYHELRKASKWKAGLCVELNVVLTCWVGNGTIIEDFPDYAHAIGLVVRNGEDLEDAWERMARARRGEVDLSGIRRPIFLPNGTIQSVVW